MNREDWVIEVRDASLERQGRVKLQGGRFAAELNDNEASVWTLETLADPVVLEYLQTGGGITVSYRGQVKLTGPLRGRIRTWNRAGKSGFTASGVSDSGWLDDRHVQPSAWPFSTEEDVRTGTAEAAGKGFVLANLGTGAESSRRLTGLTIAPTVGVGASNTWRGRLQVLGDLLREIALYGGDLRFDIEQVNTGLVFDMFERNDLSDQVIFTPNLLNIESFRYDIQAPAANAVIVGGDGEGVSRLFGRRTDSASIAEWGRIEKFIEVRSSDLAELQAAGDAELAKSAARFTAKVQPITSKAMPYGDLWNIGDIASIELDGIRISEVIRKIRIEITEKTARVEPSIETAGAVPDSPDRVLWEQLAETSRRVRSYERR